MARKRRNSSSSESEDLPEAKRPRPFPIAESDLDFEPTTHEAPRVNPTYGQKGAFPGLTDTSEGDELFYGPASNGLEYLRMVRSEARGVPHVLVGTNPEARSNAANGYRDEELEGGYYQDGAFIAAPDAGSNLIGLKSAPPDAQEAYYMALVSRFQQLRIHLHQTPSISAIESLTSNQPISIPPESSEAKRRWRYHLQSQEPRMVQIACMDMESILEIVKLLKNSLTDTVRSRSREKITRLGIWIWGILGKCNEVGQLGSEEISELRELGKRAVGLLVGIRDRSGEAYGQLEDNEEEGDILRGEETKDGNVVHQQDDGAPDKGTIPSLTSHAMAPQQSLLQSPQLEPAKATLQDRLSAEDQSELNGGLSEEGEVEEDEVKDSSNGETEMSIEEQVRVMLDMIITVVGELYGQRDLLEFRDIWDGEQ